MEREKLLQKYRYLSTEWKEKLLQKHRYLALNGKIETFAKTQMPFH